MERLAPLTAVGGLVVVLGTASYLCGWQLGWIELMVIAAGCFFALAVAAPFVIGKMKLDVERKLEPERVMVGDKAVAWLYVTNPGGAQLRPWIIEEMRGGEALPVRVEVPALQAGERHPTVYSLPTGRRGRIRVGPAVIVRQDPLHLFRREVSQAEAQDFWVHPTYVPLPPLPVGFAKDLEGPTSETSPVGDVAFHTLREYVVGDDFRHIHWMSTARAMRPMVRHYVDNRRPHLLISIDDRSSVLDGGQFEAAMEIAASLAVSAMLHQEPIAVWRTDGPVLGSTSPGGQNDFLDRLADAHPVPSGDPRQVAFTALRVERGTSAIVLLTGGVDAEDLLPTVQEAKRSVRVLVVRVWPEGQVERGIIPGARVFDVANLDEFVRAWRGVAA